MTSYLELPSQWLCKTKSNQQSAWLYLEKQIHGHILRVYPLTSLFHFQWQVRDTVRIFLQMVTINHSCHLGVTQWQKVSMASVSTVTHLRTTILQAARWSIRNLWKQSSCMTIPSTAPCFFTMGLKLKNPVNRLSYLPESCVPEQALICLKAIECSCYSLKWLFVVGKCVEIHSW